jgi:uncharacterized protein (TIGR03790 family)
VKVMRLDGPQPANVRDIIIHSIQAEREGLTGRFAIDSRGLGVRDAAGNPDAYGQFDQTLRNLASFVREHTQMEVVHNDEPEVFPPDSVEDVALYAGWYSLRNYVPAFTFNTGAVGYHIASAELLSLREVGERGWVRGLLGDGVVASFGPVAEPYLHSFPVPDEFFPLLMTGELTLAEVYWMTNPLVSWMICAIGDPLYRPFGENPQVGREVLPESLRTRMEQRASQDAEPAGR